MLSAGLSGTVNGAWEVADADQFAGIANFTDKGDLWKKRLLKFGDIYKLSIADRSIGAVTVFDDTSTVYRGFE